MEVVLSHGNYLNDGLKCEYCGKGIVGDLYYGTEVIRLIMPTNCHENCVDNYTGHYPIIEEPIRVNFYTKTAQQ